MTLTAVKCGAFTHHLALTSPEPARLAAFYADAMDMTARQTGAAWLVCGPGRRLIVSQGAKNGLGHVGMGVRDADALAEIEARARQEGLAPRPFEAGALFRSGAFAVTDPDGNVMAFGLGADEAPAKGLRGPLQHVTLATQDIARFEAFYAGKLGFAVSDTVVRESDGKVMTVFLRSNHEHHTIGVFFQNRTGIDHHSYEAGEWGVMKDWCDRLGDRHIKLDWGPGRHGPGNNLFAFITDPDGNWIEISAELEVIYDRPSKTWKHEERTLNLWGPSRLRA
jgi:catechol 2,3-dioxygenase-like lactoylglutathione lyase family enzyme